MTEEIPRAIAEALGHMPGCLLGIVQMYAARLDPHIELIEAIMARQVDWMNPTADQLATHRRIVDEINARQVDWLAAINNRLSQPYYY